MERARARTGDARPLGDTVAGRPDWVDAELFPFQSHFMQVDGNHVHYIDEGSGPPLLMVHGNPTWSFLFRNLVAELRSRFRCVVPDLPGFGLSGARPEYRFTPAEHAEVLRRLVSHLQLTGITLFVQDWGRPIGFHCAAREPDRYTAFVIGNSWAWPVESDPHFRTFSRLFGGPLGRFAVRHANAFVNLSIPAGHRNRRLTKREMSMYRGPFSTRASRLPTSIFPREIVGSSVWLREVERGLVRVAHLPALIVWGDRDFAFRGRERRRFETLFPMHRTEVVPGAGHYLWDDAPDAVLAAFDEWWPHRSQ